MKIAVIVASAALLAGCGGVYSWRSSVPESRRTVAVPTFRNESGLQEIGAVASRQLLREFQREGTFRIASVDDAAIEVQGTVKSVSSSSDGYSRRVVGRSTGYTMRVTAEITVVDRISGEVLVAGRKYSATTTFATVHDLTTAQRDASGRVADTLARSIVDDMLKMDWSDASVGKKESK